MARSPRYTDYSSLILHHHIKGAEGRMKPQLTCICRCTKADYSAMTSVAADYITFAGRAEVEGAALDKHPPLTLLVATREWPTSPDDYVPLPLEYYVHRSAAEKKQEAERRKRDHEIYMEESRIKRQHLAEKTAKVKILQAAEAIYDVDRHNESFSEASDELRAKYLAYAEAVAKVFK